MPATYEAISTTTLGSAASSITFSSIPGTYTDLKVIVQAITSTNDRLLLRVNSDTGTNYSETAIYGDGSAAASTRYTSASSFARSATGGFATNIFWEIDIFSYAGSTNKTCLARGNGDNNGSGQVYYTVGLWRNTAAITSVDVRSGATSNLLSGTTATLYGILKA